MLSRIPVRRPVTPVPHISRPRRSEPSLGGHDTAQTRPGQWLFAVQGSDYVTVSGRCEPHASCASFQQRDGDFARGPKIPEADISLSVGFSHARGEGEGSDSGGRWSREGSQSWAVEGREPRPGSGESLGIFSFSPLIIFYLYFRPFWTRELCRLACDEAIILDVSPVPVPVGFPPPRVRALVRRLSAHDPLFCFLFPSHRLLVRGRICSANRSCWKRRAIGAWYFLSTPPSLSRDASLLRLFPCPRRGQLPL